MQSQKPHKIDLNTEYPCPCRRRGRIVPIVLTEAFGCNRCQQIFVVEENGYLLEQLSTTYPYKQAWRWMGDRWTKAYTGMKDSYLPLAMGIVFALLVVWLPLALQSPLSSNIIPWVLVALILALLPALMVWLAYRR
ncbi:MAG: hypothetical protein N3E45_13810 [Oscillatoriaceae bacterium SKW80]|nr:hypothetical protein [Oscillatoriaceae bacterium SKYG93]MCX8121875.1 hypothetical protein [Oscillatoriaceae bacterium SKW80]MDW8454636.1 hypothetical protein [Oscillatoriaceae cyanobacterium SKYGB_i_bin93]HIK27446.1 hypothetical protein [Oscillatoriaceae cyanobacterium M7585_C2015_266]